VFGTELFGSTLERLIDEGRGDGFLGWEVVE